MTCCQTRRREGDIHYMKHSQRVFSSHGDCAANDMWVVTVLMWCLWMEETANKYYSQAASEGSFRIGAKLNDHRFATKRLWVSVLFCSSLILRTQCTNSKLVAASIIYLWWAFASMAHSDWLLCCTLLHACLLYFWVRTVYWWLPAVLSSMISAFYIEANVHLVWTIHISFYDWGTKQRFLLKCTAL